ncbi:MAG: three-Cys-motif partner protein TcmP, partial [Candidatus Eremiobacterota bacterium]
MFEAEWSLDNKPHTRTKLEIFKKYFDVWLKIWNNQNWVSNTWYYIDLYSGRGIHNYKGENCYGSPLIFLDQLRNKLTDNSVEFKSSLNIHMFLVEEDKRTFTCLKENVDAFLQENPVVSNFVSIYYFNNDC